METDQEDYIHLAIYFQESIMSDSNRMKCLHNSVIFNHVSFYFAFWLILN